MKLDKLMYSITDTGEILGLSKHTVGRDVRRGIIEARRYGRRVLIPREEILRIAAVGLRPVDVDAASHRA
jgi:excisionase family DNA binding protein